MISIIKNRTNQKDYNNQSYNEDGIKYILKTDGDRYKLSESIFGRSLLTEFGKSLAIIEKEFKSNTLPEDKLVRNIINGLYSNSLILNNLIEMLDPIYYLPNEVENENDSILEVCEGLLSENYSLDPSVYLFHYDLFIPNFVSLLMHSHSLLDKIAIYVRDIIIFNNSSNERLIFGRTLNNSERRNKPYYFSNLIDNISILKDNNTNKVLDTIFNELCQLNNLKSIIIPGASKTLRNKIVHQETILDMGNSIFSVYRYKKKFIKLDSFVEGVNEVKNYPPIVNCIDRIHKSIMSFTLSILNSILNDRLNLSLNQSITASSIPWVNPFYDYTNDIVDESYSGDKLKLNTFDISSNGLTLKDFYYIKKDLFS